MQHIFRWFVSKSLRTCPPSCFSTFYSAQPGEAMNPIGFSHQDKGLLPRDRLSWALGPYCFVPSKLHKSMDRFKGQKVHLNSSVLTISVPIRALTPPTTVPYFISKASFSCFPLKSIFSPFLISSFSSLTAICLFLFCFM